METSFYSDEEIRKIGFRSCGENVKISKKASIYGAENMVIGNNVRVDDFCLLSGKITFGNHIHIAAYSALFGGQTGIEMKDFSGLSSRCVVYAESDDYSGESLTNPTVPKCYSVITTGKVTLGKHVIVGTGSAILPGVTIGDGSAVGSMSLVNQSLAEWGIYVGIPCRFQKSRSTKLLNLETQLLKEERKNEI